LELSQKGDFCIFFQAENRGFIPIVSLKNLVSLKEFEFNIKEIPESIYITIDN
jgi:hypothetical protein